MLFRRALSVLVGIFVGAWQPGTAAARTVEYLTDMAAIRAAAEDQGIAGPFSDPPPDGQRPIALVSPAAADHRVIVASIYCQAYQIENPVSLLLQDLVAASNRPNASASEARASDSLSLRLVSGSSVLRCMGKNDVQAICKNRVKIVAEAQFLGRDGTPHKEQIVSEVEREGRVGGFCGNIARYTGIVTREAAISLLAKARALASS